MSALIEALHDAVRWVKGEPPHVPEPPPDPTRIWLREQEIEARKAVQERRDYLEDLMVYRRDNATERRGE